MNSNDSLCVICKKNPRNYDETVKRFNSACSNCINNSSQTNNSLCVICKKNPRYYNEAVKLYNSTCANCISKF